MGAPLPEHPNDTTTSWLEIRPCVSLEDFGEAFTPELQEQEAKLAEQLRSQQQA